MCSHQYRHRLPSSRRGSSLLGEALAGTKLLTATHSQQPSDLPSTAVPPAAAPRAQLIPPVRSRRSSVGGYYCHVPIWEPAADGVPRARFGSAFNVSSPYIPGRGAASATGSRARDPALAVVAVAGTSTTTRNAPASTDA